MLIEINAGPSAQGSRLHDLENEYMDLYRQCSCMKAEARRRSVEAARKVVLREEV